MLKYHNGHFPFADRFRDAFDQGPNWDAWDVPLYIPEWDLTVRRRLNGYCASSYRYYTEERVLYGINWREYGFLPLMGSFMGNISVPRVLVSSTFSPPCRLISWKILVNTDYNI